MPLFDKNSNHSVLAGDYLGNNQNQDLLFEVFQESVCPVRNIGYKHSTQFYIIYINNLTETMFSRFATELIDYGPFVGFADTTYGSRFKTFLSTMLVNAFLKHKNIIIQGHPDDVPNHEDENTTGYPFEEYGYSCRSIQSQIEGTMLSYKIERPVYPGFEVDTEFSLNAISDTPLPVKNLEIDVAEQKVAYLKSQKAGSLLKAELLNVNSEMLAKLIAERISQNYLYNLAFDEKKNVAKFNVIIELPALEDNPPVKLLAALAYEPENKKLRLITFY